MREQGRALATLRGCEEKHAITTALIRAEAEGAAAAAQESSD
jgi:hypothetical protein